MDILPILEVKHNCIPVVSSADQAGFCGSKAPDGILPSIQDIELLVSADVEANHSATPISSEDKIVEDQHAINEVLNAGEGTGRE